MTKECSNQSQSALFSPQSENLTICFGLKTKQSKTKKQTKELYQAGRIQTSKAGILGEAGDTVRTLQLFLSKYRIPEPPHHSATVGTLILKPPQIYPAVQISQHQCRMLSAAHTYTDGTQTPKKTLGKQPNFCALNITITWHFNSYSVTVLKAITIKQFKTPFGSASKEKAAF